MKPRPTSVTVISWILIVTAALSAVSMLITMNNPMVHELMAKSPIPVPIQYGITVIGLLVTMVSGIFMLDRANWARLLYMGWSAAGFFFSFMTSPVKLMLLPGVIVFGLFVFFLTRPHVVAYFKGVPDETP